MNTQQTNGFFDKIKKIIARTLARAARMILPALLITGSTAHAAPQGGIVSGGVVNIAQPDPLTTEITQFTDKGIINWSRFDVDVNELVQFIQPGAERQKKNKIKHKVT